MKEQAVNSKTASERIAPAQRLLLADDEPIIVATLADVLRHAGFDVTAVTTAVDAIEHARRVHFSLAILDYAMPGQNGIELAACFRQLQQPFMFLTAHRTESLVEQAVTVGALAYVVKPIDPLQFVPTVRTAVRRASELAALLEERERLTESITTNRDVSVAVGLLMAQRGLSRQAAFETLRQHARRIRRPLRELAVEVTAASETMYGIPSAPRAEASATARGRSAAEHDEA